MERTLVYYELRISVEQEVRVILFAVDNPNINLSQRVIFLNGFIKKANKDYVKEVEKAMEILRRLLWNQTGVNVLQ